MNYNLLNKNFDKINLIRYRLNGSYHKQRVKIMSKNSKQAKTKNNLSKLSNEKILTLDKIDDDVVLLELLRLKKDYEKAEKTINNIVVRRTIVNKFLSIEAQEKITSEVDMEIVEAENKVKALKARKRIDLQGYGIETLNITSAGSRRGVKKGSRYTFNFQISGDKEKVFTFAVKDEHLEKSFRQSIPITQTRDMQFITYDDRIAYLNDCMLFHGIAPTAENNRKDGFTLKMVEYLRPRGIKTIAHNGSEIIQRDTKHALQ